MPRSCPEIGRSGGRREAGVKAVEDYRSPCPGGITARLGADEYPWGLRRELHEAGGGWLRMRRIPESRCDFILHDVDGELVMRHDCPEIRRGKPQRKK